MREPRFIQLTGIDSGALVAEVARGVLDAPAHIPPKLFYDALGSRLFDAITALDEYYPTRTEEGILAAQGQDMAASARAVVGSHPVLVDLGAGNCAKAARLFGLLSPRRYVAVDISADHLRGALSGLQREHPALEMVGIGTDFSASLALPPGACDGPALVFYPGSSIGNFAPEEARRFLGEARGVAQGGALLIGVDLVKPRAILEAAYDDHLGVTAAFNRNLLRHVNRLLGADFAVRNWGHVAFFDEEASRIEMHLESLSDTVVRWPGAERRFVAGERIHTENSYKWRAEDFASLLGRAGFSDTRCWTDPQGWFAVFLAWG